MGEPAARGAWANSRKMLLSRSYRDLSVGPIKLRKISTANTEMHAATIIGVLGRRVRALLEARKLEEQLQPRDHSACKHRPRQWDEGYIRIGTLVRYLQSSHSEIRNIFEGIIEVVRENGRFLFSFST